MIFVYITNPTKEEAKKIAKQLLEQRLVACANIFPIESMYHWKGKMADEEQFVLLGKTSEENYEKIVSEVNKIHSYTIPCITKIPIFPNSEYENWLNSELG